MRAGINWLAVGVAAVAIWALGFVIYGLIVPQDVWLEGSGITPAEIETVGAARMPFMAVMPIMTAIFLAVIFQWARVDGAANGAKWGLLIAFASAIPALLYGWVYGIGPLSITLLDIAHLALGHAVAGAILGGWKKAG